MGISSADNFKVDFFIVGAAKSATTNLADDLATHTEVNFSKFKEPRFFSPELYPRTGAGAKEFNRTFCKSWDDYKKLFDKPFGIKGEGSVDYLWNQSSAKRIFEHNSMAKIIVVLRDPIDRAVSEHKHLIREGLTSENFFNTWKAEEASIENDNIPLFYHQTRSKYFEALQRYINLFPLENILVIDFCDLKDDYVHELEKITAFLGVSKLHTLDSKKSNEGRIPKSKFIQSILNSYYLKEMLKYVIPYSAGVKAKAKLRELNSCSRKSFEIGGDVNTLVPTFSEDTLQVEKLLCRKLKYSKRYI